MDQTEIKIILLKKGMRLRIEKVAVGHDKDISMMPSLRSLFYFLSFSRELLQIQANSAMMSLAADLWKAQASSPVGMI